MQRAVLIFTLMVSLGLAGCSSRRAKTPRSGSASHAATTTVTTPRVPAKDRVLWQYRNGLAALRAGQFDEAKSLLDDALLTIGNAIGKDPSARKARGLFNSEAKKNFIGEPYERAMAYYYRGILYWMDGEPDNARACFRSAAFEDSDAVDKRYASDYVLLDYLDGYASAKLKGDGSDAFERARKVARLSTPLPYQENANVLFFVDFGGGPTKYAAGEYAQHLMFREGSKLVQAVQIQVGGKAYQLRPYDELYFQATTRGGRVMDHILANKAKFKDTTDAMGTMAILGGAGVGMAGGREAQPVALGLIAAGILSKIASSATTPEADVRTWDNLPNYLSFAALSLPPGEHTAQVDFLNAGMQVLPGLTKAFTFTVPADGRDKVIYVSEKSKTPQNL